MEWWDNFWERIYEMLNATGQWVLELPINAVIGIRDSFLSFVPDSLVADFSPYVEWLVVVNEWVPLGESVQVFIVVSTFKLACSSLKAVLRFVPTLGG